MSHPQGIRPEAVTDWLRRRVPGLRAPLRFELIAGGRSNLTYRISDADGRAWALRRPPLHGLLASAHDVGREYRIMAALAPTSIPVPTPVGLCDDPEVTGAPFYVMEFIEGDIIRNVKDAEASLIPDQRRTVAERLVDVLADLHDLEPDDVGLGELGPREHYIERQLRRWRRQFEHVATRDLPLIDELHDRLLPGVPPQGPARIVHGDYRLDNLILSGDDIAAVLDWELCTLGDPLADLGALMVYWAGSSPERSSVLAAPTTADGFPTREEVADRYARQSGRNLSRLDYYMAFAYWRVAVILEGVYSRFSSGAYGEVDDSYRQFADEVVFLAERGMEAIERAGG